MLAPKSDNSLIIKNKDFTIEINHQSGFCFGVVNAIAKAEENLNSNDGLYCLGSIVHNEQEVSRLIQKGLQIIDHHQVSALKNKKILFRAHGEPPVSYQLVKKSGGQLIDATCPVVLKIQERIKKAYQAALETNGQIVIYGKSHHAEVIGLTGQTNNTAIIILSSEDFHQIDFNRPIELFSQTTMSIATFTELAQQLQSLAKAGIKINDTVCRQVSNREQQIKNFALRFDIVFFVGDNSSSNSKILFEACKVSNINSHFISNPSDINAKLLYKKYKTIGICGATSTPLWLMQEVAQYINDLIC